jgi:hypothetical protein
VLGPAGQLGQLQVVQVAGTQPHRDAALLQQQPDPAGGRINAGGRLALAGPPATQDGVGGIGGGAAQRPAEPEQVAKIGRDHIGRRLLRGGHRDHAGRPSSGHEVAQQDREGGRGLAIGTVGVERQLLDYH